MLEDRSYMRGSGYERRMSAAVIIMIANVAIFVLQEILRVWGGAGFFNTYAELFALSTGGLAKGYIWQLLTFQFMHGGLFHLIANLLVLYFFGRAVEDALGTRGFLKLYLSSGVIGGLVQIGFALAAPNYFGGSVVGASAGAFGLLAAFATMFPERELTLLLFFIIPVSMRARTLLWISIGLAVFGIIVPSGGIAHAAHLGGIAAGIGYIHWFVRRGWAFPDFSLRRPKRVPREYARTANPKRPFWVKPAKPNDMEDLPAGEFISKEVDPILDKISAHGIQSLTDRERRILEAARAKMAKR